MKLSYYSEVGYGDALLHLNYCRRLIQANPGLEIDYYLKPEQHHNLAELTEDLPQLKLGHVDHRPVDALNSWIAAGSYFTDYPERNKYHLKFYLDWWRHLSGVVGLESPIKTPEDMLFNYPALQKETALYDFNPDILFINSYPNSYQFADYSPWALDSLISALARKNQVVVTQSCGIDQVRTTAGLTLTGIGNLSTRCKYIVAIATGPIWPTFNVWNHNRVQKRIIMVDNEFLEYDSSCIHARTIDEARQLCAQEGLL